MKSGTGLLFSFLSFDYSFAYDAVPKDCLTDPQLPVGYVRVGPSVRTHLSAVPVACASGYDVADSVEQTQRSVVCVNGDWTTNSLQCFKTCSAYEELGGGSYIINVINDNGTTRLESVGEEISMNTARSGARRLVSCSDGFGDAAGIKEQTLVCANGEWTSLRLDCDSNCGSYSSILASRTDLQVISTSTGYDGNSADSPKASIELACISGLGPIGAKASSTIYCVGGEWETPELQCGKLCPAQSEFKYFQSSEVSVERYTVEWQGNNPGSFTKVSCADGYSPLKYYNVTSLTNDANNQYIKVYCLDGSFEDVDFQCRRNCPQYTLPSTTGYVVTDDATASNEHGSTRTVKCADSWSSTLHDIHQDVSRCVDGEWTPVELKCAPTCPTARMGFLYCDYSEDTGACSSPFEMRWYGPNGNDTEPSLTWRSYDSITPGVNVEVRCNQDAGFRPTDGTTNDWINATCIGSTSPSAGPEAYSVIGRECEKSCLAGDLNIGPAYQIGVRLPTGPITYTQWLTIEKAAYASGWTPDNSTTSDAGNSGNTTTLIQQKHLDGKVNLSRWATRTHPHFKRHLNNLVESMKHSRHPETIKKVRAMEKHIEKHGGLSVFLQPFNARHTLSNQGAIDSHFANLPKDKRMFADAVRMSHIAAKNSRILQSLFPKTYRSTERLHGKRPSINSLATLIHRGQETGLHPSHIQLAMRSGARNKLLPMAKIIAEQVALLDPIIDSEAQALGCLNNYTMLAEVFPPTSMNAALTCDVLLSDTRPDTIERIKAEMVAKYGEDVLGNFTTDNFTKESTCDITIADMLTRMQIFPDRYTFNPLEKTIGDMCNLGCGSPYCPQSNGTSVIISQLNNIAIALAGLQNSPECADYDALPAAVLPGSSCPYSTIMWLKATGSPAESATTELCNSTFADVMIQSGSYDPDLGELPIPDDITFGRVCNYQCGQCDIVADDVDEATEEVTEEVIDWEVIDPFADQPYFNALLPYGSEANISCASGYSKTLISDDPALKDRNSEVITCIGSSFSPRALLCAKVCNRFVAPSAAFVATGAGVESATVEYGSEVYLSCGEGSYGLNGQLTQTITCIDGEWTPQTLQCMRSCSSATLPAMGRVFELFSDDETAPIDSSNAYSHGSSYAYGCIESVDGETYNPVPMYTDSGDLPASYISVSRERLRCVDGAWSPLTLMCKRNCPSPLLPDLDRYKFVIDLNATVEMDYDENGDLVPVEFTREEQAQLLTQVSLNHNSKYYIQCSDKLTAADGPVSGTDTIKCLDGRWTRQTLTCKYKCSEFYPKTEDIDVGRFAIAASKKGIDSPYPSIYAKHNDMRTVACNNATYFYPISSGDDFQTLTCNDGSWNLFSLQCRQACAPVVPSTDFTNNPILHFPPVGFCVWDAVNKRCTVPPAGFLAHDSTISLACADGFSPLSGTLPATVSCSDGEWSPLHVQCAPICKHETIVFGKYQEPECFTKAPPVLDFDSVAALLQSNNASTSASFLQRSRSDTNSTVDLNVNQTVLPVYGEAGYVPTTAQVDEFLPSNVSDVPYDYRKSIPNCNPGQRSKNFHRIQFDHGSEMSYKCVDGSDAWGVASNSTISDCIWGEWTRRGLVCKKRCSMAELNQSLLVRLNGEYYVAENDDYVSGVHTMELWAKHAGTATISCATNSTTWPIQLDGSVTETLTCMDGSWQTPTMMCMSSCEEHPLAQESYRYVIEYEDGNSRDHASVAQITCAAGTYPALVFANATQDSMCVNGVWQPLAYPCVEGCAAPPVNHKYFRPDRVVEDTDLLNKAVQKEGVLLYHGMEFTMSCIAGYTRGVQFSEWGPMIPLDTKNLTAFSYMNVTCDTGAISDTLTCFRSCAPPDTTVLKSMLDRINILDLDGNTKIWKDTWTNYTEVWPHDSEVEIECDFSNGWHNLYADYSKSVLITCRNGQWDVPRLHCRRMCPSFEQTDLGVQLIARSYYNMYARVPMYMLDNPWDQQKEVSGSVAYGKQEYALHGATWHLECMSSYSASMMERTSGNVTAPWEGDDVEVAAKSNVATLSGKAGGSATWSQSTSRQSASDMYNTVLNAYLSNTTVAADTSDYLTKRNFTRAIGRDEIKCLDGSWVGYEMRCLSKCKEFLHPGNKDIFSRGGGAAGYAISVLTEADYRGGSDYASSGKNITQSPGTESTFALVPSGSRRMITCAAGYSPLNVRGLKINAGMDYYATATCANGVWTMGSIVCSKDCTQTYSSILKQKCIDFHTNSASSPCAVSKGTAATCATKQCTDDDEPLSPYKIFRTILRDTLAPDSEDANDIQSFIGKMAVKSMTTHIITCNANQDFMATYQTLDHTHNSQPNHQEGEVGTVVCLDGKWSELPLTCDYSCPGTFDLYSEDRYWVPVFRPSGASTNYAIESYAKGGVNVVNFMSRFKSYFQVTRPSGGGSGSAPTSLQFTVSGSRGGGVGTYADKSSDMTKMYPDGSWFIYGPGACNPKNGWAPVAGTCSSRKVSRGAWVAYEHQDFRDRLYYSICTPGANTLTTTFNMETAVSTYRGSGAGYIMSKLNYDASVGVNVMGWSDPRIPIFYQAPRVTFPGSYASMAYEIPK